MIYHSEIIEAHMYWTCNNTSLEYMGGFEGKNKNFRGNMRLNNWVHTHWV